MSSIHLVSERLRRANNLASVLDAAYDAFEHMLSIIRGHEDPSDEMFTTLVMAAGSAADGRDALLFAPSLPPRRLHPADGGEEDPPHGTTPVVAGLAKLSELLASRLAGTAHAASDPRDRAACLDAARWARDIHALLTGAGP